MTTLTSLPKTTVEGAIKVVRLPIDALTGVAPESRLTSSVELAVDSADARIRAIAGSALRDDGLRSEATLLRESVAERRRAQRLRSEAGRKAEDATERAERAKAEAAERERRAEREAERKREQANKRRTERKQQAEKAEQSRRHAASERAVKAERESEAKADAERLEALQSKAESLAKRERAVTEAQEADRLKRAAERAKEERKSEVEGM